MPLKIKYTVFLIIFLLSIGAVRAQKALQIADSLISSEQYAAAEWLLKDYIANNSKNRFALADANYLLSYVNMRQNRYNAATEYNRRSLELEQELNYEFISNNYMRFGSIQLLQHHYERALDYFYQAEQLPQEDLQEVALLKGYMASAYTGLEQYERAIQYYKEGLETLLAESSEDDPDVCSMRYNMGRVYFLDGRYGLAEEQFDLTLAALPEDRQWSLRQRLYNALGATAQYDEDNVKNVKGFYKQALTICRNRKMGSKLEEARTLSNLSELFLSQNLPDSAMLYAQSGLQLLSSSQAFYRNLLQLKARIAVVRHHQTQNIADLEEALTTILQAIDLADQRRPHYLGMNAQIRLQGEEGYDIGLLVAAKLYALTGEKRYAEQAFLLSERSKARVLNGMIEALEAQSDFGLSADLRKEGERWQQQMSYWENAEEVRKDSLLYYTEAYEGWLKKVATAHPDYFQMRYNTQAPSLADIRQLLDRESLLLSYYMGDEEYYIFGLSQNDLELHALPRDSIIEPFKKKRILHTYMRKRRKIIKAGTTGIGIYTEFSKNQRALELGEAIRHYVRTIKKMNKEAYIKYSSQLYARLISPLGKMLKGKEKLIIIPHKELHYLPFETLLYKDPKGKRKYNKLPYLIRNYSVSYQHSASLLLQSHRRQQRRSLATTGFLGIAPVFSDTVEAGYIWDSRDFVLDSNMVEETVTRGLHSTNHYFKELKYSENEVVSIARLFAKKDRKSRAFIHGEASETQFKKEIGNYKYVHIASHSFVNTDRPGRSGIAFASEPDGSTEDGILFSAESFFLQLNAELVVLSSCESGTGKLAGEEGLLSLTRGFRYAGTPNIIASLWKVSDKQTSNLMRIFYDKLLNEYSYSDALRSAKLKLIKSRKTATPRLWSSFLLTETL